MRKYLISTCLLVMSVAALAQLSPSDIEKMSKHSFVHPEYNPRKVEWMKVGSRNPIVKYNPVTLAFGGAMYFYQAVLSPQLSTRCPYEISCSNFGKLAIAEFGLIKGVSMAADRMMRCNEIAAEDIVYSDITPEGRVHDPLSRYSMKSYKKHRH